MTTAVRTILLDIEGTTTPIAFVSEVLFPFARARLARYLAHGWAAPAVREDLARLRAERAAEAERDAPSWDSTSEEQERASVLAYLEWLMDRDRKSTALKSLQGKIWKEGFESGALVAPVFDDVPPALARWTRAGLEVAIFSSGSVQAQQLLFAHTSAGDLTRHLCGFFDTTTGPKREPESYAAIAAKLRRAASDVLFISDVAAELDAAREAGCRTALAVRPGNGPKESVAHERVATLDALEL